MDVVAESLPYDDQAELLKPYVPRLLIEWIHDAPTTSYLARDGSLAFVDISGFTALTERLASRGKIGAEILRDTLDGVFIALLDEAYNWGAGLLKWGGDALLLLFDGLGHPERAARAAWEMQGTIDRVGRIRVGGGGVTLRMSVGIATGTVEFFTAGSVHRELLVTGRTATETVLMEGIADAGEIALSETLAALLDPGCVGRVKGDARLLAAAPEAPAGRSPAVGQVVAAEIASCIPIAAREHVLLARSEPEHRMITAAFFDLMRTDELLAELGPTTFAEALDQRITAIQATAARYDVPFNVTDVSKGAIKVLLSAGAPSSTGHDEEQTLRLVREVMDEPGLIPMRVGVSSGRVFTGDFGPPYRRTYAVLGDAINTAARVMARAEAGEILATAEVLERSRTSFATTPIEPFTAKGKAEPVRASLVGPIQGRRDERIADTPFVGRERELAALRTVVADVKAGLGWTIEVAGPSGIGKTRLVRELFALEPEVRVLGSTCEEYEASTAYHALREPACEVLGLDRSSSPAAAERRLREVVAQSDPELEPWVPLLGILLGLDLPPTPETEALDERFLRDVLADVTLRFLVATFGASPVALVVEDAQFMDDASADLLRRLSKAAQALPHVLVIARTQPEGFWTDMADEELRFLVFDLLPLSADDAVTMVTVATDQEPLRPHEIEELVRRAGGSPLFLVELLNVARSAGTLESLPDSIEAVVTADIDRLAASDRIALRYASVLGVTFDEDLLRAVLGDEAALDEELWERLKGLVDRDASGSMRFRNSLVHDTAYEGLPFRRRRELHARAAEAIERAASSLEDEAATLALHYAAAARHAETWRHARVGGDRARAVAANVEAGRLYELALAAAGHVRGVSGSERAEALVSLGSVRETAGLLEGAYDALRRASGLLADDQVGRAQVYALRASVRVRTGSTTLALRDTAAGLQLVDDLASEGAVGARASLRSIRAQARGLQGRPREAIALAESAVAEARQANELEALGRAYGVLDQAYQTLGETDKVVHERLALDVYRELGQRRKAGFSEMNLGHQAQWAGRWDEAIEWLRLAEEDCTAAGDRPAAAGAGVVLGEILVNRRELAAAEPVLRNAWRVLRSAGFTPFALLAETQLARIVLEQGDADQALSLLAAALEEARGVGHAEFVLEVVIVFAAAARAAGRLERGLEVLDEEARRAGEDAHLRAVPLDRARGGLLVALGRLDEAEACLDRALAGARRQGLLYEELSTLRERFALARSRGDEPVEEELREAERLAQLLGVSS